jgi:hypothetical protein
MLQNITQTIAEGYLVWSSLHAHDDECLRLFNMVNDWVSLLDRCSQPIMKLHAQFNNMHAESRAMTDPVEHATKFTEI